MKRLSGLYRSLYAILGLALAWSSSPGVRPTYADADEDLAWEEARARGDATAFERFLELYPAGEHASEAYGCLVTLSLGQTDPNCSIAPAAGVDPDSDVPDQDTGSDVY